MAGESGLRAGATTAVIFGLIGACIDAAVKGRTNVFGGSDSLGHSSSVRVIPEIDAHRRAVTMAIRF